MTICKTITQLKMEMGKRIKKSLIQVGDMVIKEIQQYLMKHLYANTPEDYERTWDLFNSLTVKEIKTSGDIYTIEVYFDKDKIKSNEILNNWNQHMSFVTKNRSAGEAKYWEGQSISQALPWWIELGEDSLIFPREGIHMVKNTTEKLRSTKEHIEELKKILKTKYNIKCNII